MNIHRNSYIIKQSDGTTWKFSFKEDQGIIYTLYKENKWSEKYVLASNASENYSIILFPNDKLNVLYEDLDGMIVLGKYNGEKWNKQVIITNKNKNIFNVYFKAVFYESKIHIIFSIINKQINIATLFHQILDEENNLYKPKLIDKIKYRYNVPFILSSSYKQDMLLVYQRFESFHELGYKTFNIANQEWSDFRLLYKSPYPFKDYSAVNINGIVYASYIQEEKNLDILNFVHDDHFNFKNTILFQGSNIESCLILIILGEVWCFWIKDNDIYINFSINNGNDFCTLPYKKSLDSLNAFKGSYISNSIKERQFILCKELFISDDDSLQNLILYYIYMYNIEDIESGDYLSHIEYYMTEVRSKIISYEKKFIQKEQLITELNHKLNEQSSKFISNENIKSLQQYSTDTEEKIKLLENVNIEKEKEIISLKNQISKEETKILFLINEFKKLNDHFKIIYFNMYNQRKSMKKSK